MQWRLTDEQFIERLRWWQRHRRTVGVVSLFVGLLAVGGMLFAVQRVHERSQAVFAELDRSGTPTTQAIETQLDETRLTIAFSLGFLLAGGLSAGASLATMGFIWIVAGQHRKDRLLLQCWDNQTKP